MKLRQTQSIGGTLIGASGSTKSVNPKDSSCCVGMPKQTSKARSARTPPKLRPPILMPSSTGKGRARSQSDFIGTS
ncbi:hypothetical protein ABIC02_007666 [Bradyrhizobium sp. RT5a]